MNHASETPVQEMSEEAGPPSGGVVDVLLCDDNEAIRGLLREVLEMRPALRVVGEAADGNEAIAEAARLQPDVIVLDLAMPRRTGLEALAELRRVAPAAKIVVFSGFSMSVAGAEALGLGAVLYLQKGASIEAINDAIEEAARMTVPPAVTRASTGPATQP
jgi:DNA-binding NarL/FixJ family response regulator